MRRSSGLDADGDAAGDDLAGAPEEAGKGDALHLGFEVPDGIFERGLGHAMAANLAEDAWAGAAVKNFGVEQARGEFAFGDEPRSVDSLVAEVGMLAGDALAPAREPFGLDLDQQDAAAGGDSEAGLEGMRERHIDLAKVNGVNQHCFLSPGRSSDLPFSACESGLQSTDGPGGVFADNGVRCSKFTRLASRLRG